MNKYGLSAKLFFWLLLCAVIPTVLLAGLYLNVFKNTLLQQEQAHLSQIADNKVRQIENYIAERLADSLLLAQSFQSERALSLLPPLYRENGPQSNEYISVEGSFRDFFQRFGERGYYDVFLLSPDGEVIFTLKHGDDFATNIYTGEYLKSGLNQVVERAGFFLEASSSSFEYYPPSNVAAAFVAAPVLRDGGLLGIVALQINSDIIQHVMLDVSGSMRSREVVVASKQATFYSFQAALKHNPDIMVGKALPLAQAPKALADAMAGIRGIALSKDYRDVEVIAVSRYIPSMHWGLVLKEDLVEAMIIFDRMVQVGVIILLVLLLSILGVAGYLGRSVARPLVSMTEVTQAIAEGNSDIEVEPGGFRESQELARCFNQMSERLKEARDTLEQKVEERTCELKQEIELRQKKEQALADSYQELDHSLNHLKSAQELLIESEKMASLGSLVAGVAHEVNTPLGIAVTSASLFQNKLNAIFSALKNNTLSKKMITNHLNEMQRIITLLEGNLNRTVTLVTHFKQVAVEQSNVQRDKFDLRELAESLLYSLSPETQKYPVEIKNLIPDNIVIESYSGDFYQLLTNLILNAMIHAFDGCTEGVLTLSASVNEYGVTLIVSDNGIGISNEARKKIFEPFYTTKRGKGGSGLGLSIVYNIVKNKLNGDIIVISELEQGTEFIITCPCRME